MLRTLLTGDTHIGFDLPARPRIERRRRGHDFQANYERAVDHAIAQGVDLLIHSGDVFHRSKPRPALVDDAFRPLWRAARAGLTVMVLAGNHERSRLPRPLYAGHPNLHVVDEPRALRLEIRGMRVAIGAFPYVRQVRQAFPGQVAATGVFDAPADVRLLVVHHCFEGAVVGPAEYTFRDNPDVIAAADTPTGIAALLSGHIHRHQILRTDLCGRPLPAPMIYAGSVERTSFAEQDETKGFLELDFAPGRDGGALARHHFVPLPARPMLRRTIAADTATDAWTAIEAAITQAPADAVLDLRVAAPASVLAALPAAEIRALAPATMNIDCRPVREANATRARRR